MASQKRLLTYKVCGSFLGGGQAGMELMGAMFADKWKSHVELEG